MDAKFKCGLCQEIPEGQVFQCAAGHIFCEGCYSANNHCRQCRTPFGRQIRNTVLEVVLDSLVLECAHKKYGCEMRFTRKEIRNHNDTCVFRQSVPLCRQMGLKCSFAIPRDNVGAAVEHFTTFHKFQEVPIGVPITLALPNFRTASNLATATSSTVVWPPIMIRSGLGVGKDSSCLYSVLAIRSSNSSVDKSLSVAAVSLSDLFPVGEEEIPLRVYLSIKCGSGRVSNLDWSVTPFPTMSCKELLSSQPFRIPVPLLLSRYVEGDDGNGNGRLKIECKISRDNSQVGSLSSHSIMSIALQRLPSGQVEGGDEHLQQNESGRSPGRGGGRGGRGGRASGARADGPPN